MKKVALFLNNNGENNYGFNALRLIHEAYPDALVDILVLNEELPSYARFPSQERKDRFEDIFSKLSTLVLKECKQELADVPVSGEHILTGKFPNALVDHCKSVSYDLLIKQPLLEPEDRNIVSKGDAKLMKSIPCSIFLARETLNNSRGVLTGLSISNADDTKDPLVDHLLSVSENMALRLGNSLHIAHAWRLFGQEILKGRAPKEDYIEAINSYKDLESAEFNSFFERVAGRNKEVFYNKHIHNGDPSRVLTGLAKTLLPSLIVLGSVRRSAIQEYLLGSTAETISNTQPYSVLILKA